MHCSNQFALLHVLFSFVLLRWLGLMYFMLPINSNVVGTVFHPSIHISWLLVHVRKIVLVRVVILCVYNDLITFIHQSQKKQCKSSVGETVTPTRSMHVHVDADLLLLHALHTHVHVPVCRAADSKYVDGWRSLFFHHHGLISLYDTCMVFEIRVSIEYC